MTERNIKLTIEYEGSNYHGWQIQPNAATIQEVIQQKLSHFLQEDITLHGSGRTDAGVHALGQVANFFTNSSLPCDKILHALNGLLPDDIAVQTVEDAPDDFHSRFSAKKKHYQYTIWQGATPKVFERQRVWHVTWELDIEAMHKALTGLVGTHDFSAFRTECPKDDSNIRTIYEIELRTQNDYVIFDFRADGFLYNMVRAIVGTAVEIGRGKQTPSEMEKILNSKDRTQAGPNAPAQGLCLMEVEYE